MTETVVVAFTTLFATIAPLDVVAVFAAMTPGSTSAERRSMALRGTLLAGGILLVFALVGEVMLTSLGITLPAFRVGGGILLLLIGIDMVFSGASSASSTTSEETEEGTRKPDISVFPLAMPLIAGPGAMGAVVLLMADTHGDILKQTLVLTALTGVLLMTLIGMFLAGTIQRLMGVTGMHVISRIFGVLLTALAVQFIFDGIRNSGLLS